MKNSLKFLGLLSLVIMIVFSSCRRTDELTEEEQKIEDLSGTWNITNADVLSEPLSGVSITFTANNTTYSVTGLQAFTDANLNHNEVLGSDGTFSLSDNLDVVSLSPGGDLTIVTLNKDNGNATLSYSAPFPKSTDPESSITLTLEYTGN